MEDIEKIINSFGFKFYNGKRTRRGLICKTDKGLKELRKVTYDVQTIEFENSCKKHLFEKGYTKTDMYIENMEGEVYFKGEEYNYVLSDFVELLEYPLDNKTAISTAVENLATIHVLSQGFETDNKNQVGKFGELAQKRRIELCRIKKWISKQSSLSPLDLIVSKNYDYFINRALKTEEIINSLDYEKTVALANERKNIIHNNFKGDSIRKGASGIYVTGFEKATMDCSVVDLADFIRRQIKEDYCTSQKVDGIINEYDKVITLSDFELKTLGALVLFPAKFFKICNQSYNKRRVMISEAVVEKMEKAIAISEKEERILKELKM